MNRADRMRWLNARVTFLALGSCITLGPIVTSWTLGLRERAEFEASIEWARGVPWGAEWALEHGESVAEVSSLVTSTGLLLGGLLIVTALLRSAWAWRFQRRLLATRVQLHSEPRVLKSPDWRSGFLSSVALCVAFTIARVWGYGPTWTLVPSALVIILAGLFLHRRQHWGARFSRDALRRFLRIHASQIEGRLREGEIIHEQGWLHRVRGGGSSAPWLLALVTNQRVLVVDSVLLGLDVILRRSIPFGAVGWIRVVPPIASGAARLEIESLTEGMSALEFVELERATAFSEAITRLRGAGTAGLGALSLPEQSASGGLSVAREAGGLAEPH